MTTHLRGFCERAATPEEPGTPIRFIASTEGLARDGMVIAADGWDLKNYEANPVVLWSHDYGGRTLPIGRAERVWIEGKRLMSDLVFDQGDPFAAQVERKYREGFLTAVSVGWDTHEMEPPKGTGAARVTRAELLDISAVPVPGDPAALKARQSRALSELGRELITMTDTDDETPPDELDWQGTALLMARLFAPAALTTSDDARQRLYDRLSRRYRRHGRTAPEFLPSAHLDALDEPERRGLFFAGEPDLFPDLFEARAGAVLSKRNRDDLDQATRLIDGVITRSAKETPEPEQPETPEAPSNDALRALQRALKAKDVT